jgi:hypothetical protein
MPRSTSDVRERRLSGKVSAGCCGRWRSLCRDGSAAPGDSDKVNPWVLDQIRELIFVRSMLAWVIPNDR